MLGTRVSSRLKRGPAGLKSLLVSLGEKNKQKQNETRCTQTLLFVDSCAFGIKNGHQGLHRLLVWLCRGECFFFVVVVVVVVFIALTVACLKSRDIAKCGHARAIL